MSHAGGIPAEALLDLRRRLDDLPPQSAALKSRRRLLWPWSNSGYKPCDDAWLDNLLHSLQATTLAGAPWTGQGERGSLVSGGQTHRAHPGLD